MDTAVSITLHASSKAIASEGAILYVPMITLRGAKGRMIGSRTPEAAYRDGRSYTTSDAARAEAQRIAERMAALYPAALRAA